MTQHLVTTVPRYSIWQRLWGSWSRDKGLQLILLLLGIALFAGGLLFPVLAMLQKSLQDSDGSWVGFANFRHYLSTPSLGRTISNTLSLGLSITLLVVTVAFGYAYALTRTCMPGKSLFRLIALIPLLMPSLLPAISLVYWFGNQGIAKGLLGDASIYGPIGIVMGLSFWCFPHALMILITALSHSDARLYEAAKVLGSPAWRTFFTVTLPAARYGLLSAAIAVFTLTICDFGVAKVIGGQFSVLATDIYIQVVGLQNFSLGAVTSVILLLPALLSFALEHRVRSKMQEQSNSRSVPYQPAPHRLRDLLALLWCSLWALLFFALVGMAIYGSLVQFWPYKLNLTLDHYAFNSNSVYGWQPFINTLKLGALTAISGTVIIMVIAWVQEKGQYFAPLRHLIHLLAMLSLAVPGLVLGLGYIFFFNRADSLLSALYGTLPLMVLSCVIHYYTVGHMTALTSLKQLPKELELVAISLRISQWKTFWRITLPASLPALLEIFIYLFVNAMTTTSAVIFLYSSDTVLASVAVLNMEDSGDTATAAAMATLILLAAATVKLIQLGLSRALLERTQRWRQS
ncbi:putative 2-aminoethylphosphonate ABC transporter permease subunit [Serratia sp. DD3]|uniref:putative 2-aminoethylphosphonate ABC transporter permease subunit n=1 Tax=Serratia sp. DD3 TaxID=1410619 RepID=UPI0003C4EFFA|nr:putative 2-aminoethylphosphonate ABC transporter permease subunit [Serratia sp. DD3]KEY56491.1 sulfate transport system permease protein CysW [Serratia sp. DD3]KEY56711.1 sulfate transport system permease protein CysW [Serratia sp. DD3]KEY58356.1 sulfate transport system permease protein CysW [Serratia sp. DD3]KEY59422.1 sulfate transport system permease protein CysW [Serratia sp. DD3]